MACSPQANYTERWDPLRWLRDTLYPQKLALASLTSGGRSVGILHVISNKNHLYAGSANSGESESTTNGFYVDSWRIYLEFLFETYTLIFC
jgi:hypothetical protein